MSSIYKKGRDGYFYYQTYIYNPNTKKKDKKIFHALNTKELSEAKKKQVLYDEKYSGKNFDRHNEFKISLFSKYLKLPALILITIFLTLVISDYLKSSSKVSKEIILGENLIEKNSNKENNNSPIVHSPKSDNVDQVNESQQEHKKFIDINIVSKNSEKSICPDFKLQRVDELPGVFDQGKLYVTVDASTTQEAQRVLCDSLSKRYSNFSNIIICIYANTIAGKKLALGTKEIMNNDLIKQSWLAMYTYNQVEGEYFDNNPSGYLGVH